MAGLHHYGSPVFDRRGHRYGMTMIRRLTYHVSHNVIMCIMCIMCVMGKMIRWDMSDTRMEGKQTGQQITSSSHIIPKNDIKFGHRDPTLI